MPFLDEARREFIAKIVADLGKTIFGIGLASYLFEKFPVALKVALWVVCLILLLSSIIIHPRKKGGQ